MTVAIAVGARPRLWPTAVRQVRTLAPTRWWQTGTHLPVPPDDYLRFRSVTAYGGDGEQLPTADDVVDWLGWSREWHAAIERRG